MDPDDYAALVAALSDPKVGQDTEVATCGSASRAIDNMVRTVNHTVGSGFCLRLYGRTHRGERHGVCGVSIHFGKGEDYRVTARFDPSTQEFKCGQVRSKNLAQALLVGYFTAELTDTPASASVTEDSPWL